MKLIKLTPIRIFLGFLFLISYLIADLNKISEEEALARFPTDWISDIRIRYAYLPEGLPKQRFRFLMDDATAILSVQRAFKIKSSSYEKTLPIRDSFVFNGSDGRSIGNTWTLEFMEDDKVRLNNVRQTKSGSFFSEDYIDKSWVVNLTDNNFYEVLLDLAYEHNRSLFPRCKREEIQIEIF